MEPGEDAGVPPGTESVGPETVGTARRSDEQGVPDTTPVAESSPFVHPPWTVGLVLIAGAITVLFGVLVNPIWLVVGSPFVIALALWLYIRLVVRPKN